jgi:hypothetical protein
VKDTVDARTHPTPRTDDLDLRALSPSRWRVGDRRLDGRPGISLLGFIEHSDGLYEVTRFDSSTHRIAYRSLDDAVADFGRGPGGSEFI